METSNNNSQSNNKVVSGVDKDLMAVTLDTIRSEQELCDNPAQDTMSLDTHIKNACTCEVVTESATINAGHGETIEVDIDHEFACNACKTAIRRDALNDGVHPLVIAEIISEPDAGFRYLYNKNGIQHDRLPSADPTDLPF